jgi:predicted CXXCH cytochrome family protein
MGGKAGVTCLDCHDPHSGKTILPADNNQLCLQCHAAPTRLSAPAIEPTAHSHHATDSAGNRCVACHMPTTTYMQRDARHDHGFLKPDPLLTKELGIPNACARCHADQPVEWAIAATDKWFGAKMESRQRERARAVVAAQAEAPGAAAKLLALAATEEVPAWKATLLLLARPFAHDAAVVAAARAALAHPEPLVRSAGVQVLGVRSDAAETLRPLLNDAARVVRLDAEWALSAELPENSAARRELDAYLAQSLDQPSGQLRVGQDLFNRGRSADAEAPLRRAAAWDANSPGIHDALGTVLHALDKEADAAGEFWRAAQLQPADSGAAFRAALAFAGAGKLPDAEVALRETVRRDPRHDRAWYNLGLLLAQTQRSDAALAALKTAESLSPATADYAYAIATLLLPRGDRDGAMAAARRALVADPNHAAAREFLRRTGG